MTTLPPQAWRSRRGRLASTAMVWGFGVAQLREAARPVTAAPAPAPAPAPAR
ncbi:hypothetical protein [Ramlibacter albus]|uniref:Uncharacterized protein n=1 Tax=Ramlibacter albus TaxID=2079448 RepID=A0A923M8H5_9BURK|nr:hypothetical protein [Ramlibacter albus]MBC5765945.1 hypothetical protein [Ramlibacter albus]